MYYNYRSSIIQISKEDIIDLGLEITENYPVNNDRFSDYRYLVNKNIDEYISKFKYVENLYPTDIPDFIYYRLEGAMNYIATPNSFKINKYLRNIINTIQPYDLETINLLSKVINIGKSKYNLILDRYVNFENIYSYFNLLSDNIYEINKILNQNFIGHEFIEKGFVSTSWNKNNVFTSRSIKLKILVSKGKNIFVTRNFLES
ncbi:ADP-ribosyltransferase [Pseudostreptobacillus hongkongensis]|uniref:ADP-ribosyltransferase n=1 Tax=Pseudostreptobacillus hongkongensis TaxID=1162717 RepID=UPI0028D3725F|nr:ADP-ribosyltransferase [Pseudostreptobacillus hongkongensis]